MPDQKIQMPMSTAGITRFEGVESKMNFKPGHVIVLAICIVVLILFLHSFGAKLLGF